MITWSLSEPAGNIQDFTWTPTVNRFQAVLRKDGSVDLSYDEVAAKDAIVGLYPMLDGRPQQELATLSAEEHANVPAHLDRKRVKLTVLYFAKAPQGAPENAIWIRRSRG